MPTLADQDAIAATAEAAAIPRHVAIIMDGNGRWAAARGLPRGEGHRRGVEAVRRTVSAAIELGIRHLTLFSFSSENWSRPPTRSISCSACSASTSAATSPSCTNAAYASA